MMAEIKLDMGEIEEIIKKAIKLKYGHEIASLIWEDHNHPSGVILFMKE